MTAQSMTFTALSARCDDCWHGVASEYLDGDDREMVVFWRNNSCIITPANPNAWDIDGYEREVIGTSIGDEILDREQLVDCIGLTQVQGFETTHEYED